MNRLLPVLLIFTLITFAGFSWYLPGFGKGVVAKKQQLEAIKQEEKNFPELTSLLESKKDKLTILEKAFPKKDSLVPVVQAIDQLAVETGVIASLHFENEQPVADPSGNTILPITITIQGSFANCIAFLERLKQTSYVFDLQTIEGNAKTGIKTENVIVAKGSLYVANK